MRSSTRAPAFVGREREIEGLRSVLSRARDGRLTIAIIQGEAGIGKTRLVDELLGSAELEGVTIYRTACLEHERTRAPSRS